MSGCSTAKLEQFERLEHLERSLVLSLVDPKVRYNTGRVKGNGDVCQVMILIQLITALPAAGLFIHTPAPLVAFVQALGAGR